MVAKHLAVGSRCAWSRLVAIATAAWIVLLPVAAMAQEKLPLIKRLDGATRAKVLATMAGLIILGFAMVLLAWLGARTTRRYMHGTSYFRPAQRPARSDWTPQPLKPGDKLADEPDQEGES